MLSESRGSQLLCRRAQRNTLSPAKDEADLEGGERELTLPEGSLLLPRLGGDVGELQGRRIGGGGRKKKEKAGAERGRGCQSRGT